MANTFKLKTNAAMPASAGTPDDLYTVPADTTTVIIGLTLTNVHTSAVTATVQIASTTVDTGQPAATQTNQTVNVIKDVSILAGSSLELMAGNKYILQTTDIVKVDCNVSGKIDATLSIMEIT